MTLPLHRFVRPLLAGVASAVLAGAAGAASTMPTSRNDEEEKPWEEAQWTPPASFSLDKVRTFRLEQTTTMEFGIEPTTLQVGSDGVIRYVFVARSASGALNVLYEGVRCQTAETRIYARWDPASGWRQSGTGSSEQSWQPLSFRGATRRQMFMARAGLCDGPTPNNPPARMLNELERGKPDLR
ncbi:CNP1-like family protein [Hydrogenophaga sp. IBVHS2]|uniref:CNP1-like family protein n=1 Tax=Hydrogenophaga sp. IBVHS2 TaxID=1985170 RepID=UPI000A2D918E|nr:CNP1-like family protein [Hydrogenophaga sp. IBVHS2]OSZ62910.1 hypothetical protein CAP38_14205 [Hydrogenophaga sp. IBVHS2]